MRKMVAVRKINFSFAGNCNECTPRNHLAKQLSQFAVFYLKTESNSASGWIRVETQLTTNDKTG